MRDALAEVIHNVMSTYNHEIDRSDKVLHDLIADAVLQHLASQRQELAWLIEDTRTRQATWWDGEDFTEDSMLAIRFSRQIDAERVMFLLLAKRRRLIATEHMWS